MSTQQIAPQCSSCETPMNLKPSGVSKRTNEPYPPFWSCPNYKSCGGKTIAYTPPTPKPRQNPAAAPTMPQKAFPVPKDSLPSDVLLQAIYNDVQKILQILDKEGFSETDEANEQLEEAKEQE